MPAEPTPGPARYALPSRLLHWVMAVMVIAQLVVGAAMIASLTDYARLRAVHEPLGIAILVLVVIRIGNRLRRRPPPFPSTMRPLERLAAKGTEYLLYALMLAQPLIGWAMLSSAGSPIVIYEGLHLPAIAPQDAGTYAMLQQAHTVLAYLLFLTFTAHMCAVAFHTLVLRDRLLDRMTPLPVRSD
ncbi:cytochrome b [Rhodococcus tukisamuensis]|uniref:Cytochrome b561 n=1 Tax=Rhodococcus tukisamuensis TaxID=168276 RepID=A0A1G6Y1L2_9NOCA|nr:cytochrome b/b6 domain-containing protein [Rhodococcus tukisamuensis]SDD84161.1 cytochrome b561 [Rhodococcus tukisamuensis]